MLQPQQGLSRTPLSSTSQRVLFPCPATLSRPVKDNPPVKTCKNIVSPRIPPTGRFFDAVVVPEMKRIKAARSRFAI